MNFVTLCQSYLHHTQRLSLLHLAQNGTEDLIELFAQLCSCSRDQGGHQPAHKGGRELRGPGVQELVDHLHDVPQAAVSLLIPPLCDLLEGDRDVRSQALTAILEEEGGKKTKGNGGKI